MTEVDLTPTIIAKSDQLNADDLLGGPRTIRITRVTAGTADQPINIYYEGDGGKPWRPCKTMRRALVGMWGQKGSVYVGRYLTLYREPAVKFGGIEVGGIRISHASDIEADVILQLTATRGKKEPVKIRRLVLQNGNGAAPSTQTAGRPPGDLPVTLAAIEMSPTLAQLDSVRSDARGKQWSNEEKDTIRRALETRTAQLNDPDYQDPNE